MQQQQQQKQQKDFLFFSLQLLRIKRAEAVAATRGLLLSFFFVSLEIKRALIWDPAAATTTTTERTSCCFLLHLLRIK
jgi:hypothetical protein